MTVELHYKLLSKLLPVICTVNNIGLAGLFSECIYSDFCEVVTNEMDNKLPSKIGKIYLGIKKSTRKRKKEYQPCWCTELGDFWVDMCEAEND